MSQNASSIFLKNHYRTFVRVSVVAYLLFLSFHFVVWSGFTSYLLSRSDNLYVGDLSRIGYQLPSLQLRKTEDLLEKKHIEYSDWQGEPVDIITTGDSFSEGGGKGKNSYYQDYIATLHDLKVLNVPQSSKQDHFIDKILSWKKNGLLDKAKPKAVLLETGARLAVNEYTRDIDWEMESIPSENENAPNNNQAEQDSIPFINTANYKFLLYNLLYQFSPNAFDYSSAFKLKLDKPFFTAPAHSTLLFYQNDVSELNHFKDENIQLINENLNRLARILKQEGIVLIVMLVADKYDLYSPYILDNPYPENRFFELFRPLHKDYEFIDTKAILSALLERNEIDLYFSDDTHWNYKASKAIANETPFAEMIKIH